MSISLSPIQESEGTPMKWIEQAIAQREKHPTATILAPAVTLKAPVAEVLADLVDGPDRNASKGLIFWAILPRVGRVRVHMVADHDAEDDLPEPC